MGGMADVCFRFSIWVTSSRLSYAVDGASSRISRSACGTANADLCLRERHSQCEIMRLFLKAVHTSVSSPIAQKLATKLSALQGWLAYCRVVVAVRVMSVAPLFRKK